MKFPRPYFDVLRQHFRADPNSVHVCTKARLVGEPSAADTGAMRMSEALCLATGLLDNRSALLELAHEGDGSGLMLGPFDYKGDMCHHGMAKRAADLAHFLVEHWGRPIEMTRPDPEPKEPPEAIRQMTGVIAFLGVEGLDAESHIDLWERSACLGVPHWRCRKAFFWRLD